MTKERCFACDRPLGKSPKKAVTIDGSIQFVGNDCADKIARAGFGGYQPPKGGPKLYAYTKLHEL